MKIWILLLCGTLFASPTTLLEKIQAGAPGDYIVTCSQKKYTLIHLHSRTPTTVIIEEIATNAMQDWPAWVEKKAPGHTSWVQYEFDLRDGKLLECYSHTQKQWLRPEQDLLTTLITLPASQITEKHRKRIGVPPPHHAIDIRRIWNPPKIENGHTDKDYVFDAYQTKWPKDDSELSNKKIALYFDPNGFPFPYWIEISGKVDAKIHTIDSGHHLSSPYTHLPRRYPFPIGGYRKVDKSYEITIDAPPYYSDFTLYVTDTENHISKPYPCAIHQEGNHCRICFDPKELLPTHQLILTPASHPHIFVELPKISG